MDGAAVKQCLDHLLANHDRTPGDTLSAALQAGDIDAAYGMAYDAYPNFENGGYPFSSIQTTRAFFASINMESPHHSGCCPSQPSAAERGNAILTNRICCDNIYHNKEQICPVLSNARAGWKAEKRTGCKARHTTVL